MTLSEIRDKIKLLIRGRNPNLFSDSDINNLINLYQKFIATVVPESYLESLIIDHSGTITVAGEYSLPTDFSRIAGNVAINNTNIYRILPAQEVIASENNLYVSSDNIAYIQQKKLIFSPAVQLNDSVRFFYIRQPTDLVNDTDVSELAEEIIPLLIYRVAIDMVISIGSTEAYTMMENRFSNELTLLNTMSVKDEAMWRKIENV